ncbi:MAG: 50S ribosomal protein L4 [Candidatus Doudnabacteria bacterium]|nr:50S ribosomal protein L4 [Candidatus Doudnabacteria bacterium]
MKVNLYNQKAEVVGDVELNSKIFDVKPKTHLLAEAVRIQQSNARQGSAHTKTRGEVSGGGKKPWKQKGTGRARAGSTRSPIWRHGGVTFGPRSNRNWELKLNKKAKVQALFMTLSDKAKENRFIVVDQISMENPKTKDMAKILDGLKNAVKNSGKKQLLVMAKKDDKLVRSSRNLPFVTPILASSLNLLDILKADSMIVLKDSLQVIEKTYLKNNVK